MRSSEWFGDHPVIGDRSPSEAASKLREIGDEQTATVLEAVRQTEATPTRTFGTWQSLWPFQDRPWQHTAHVFGYLAPRAGPGAAPLIHAGELSADQSLRNSRVKVTLDALRVAGYPGWGDHRILFDFYAQNQVPGNVEHLHYTLTFRAREGERAAVIGYPIFVGLGVGSEGLAFKCFTVNVKNDGDEAFLNFLESDVLRDGLKLATTVQPAVSIVSGFALGLTRAVAARNRNVPVQDFYLGLDFSDIATRARLAEGSYIAIQVPEKGRRLWDWDEWTYQPTSGQLANVNDPEQLVPFNYIAFSVSRYRGE